MFTVNNFNKCFKIKLTAWQLLCDHPKRSRPFSASELDLAGSFILCNLCEQSPSSRQKIFSSFGKVDYKI